MADNDLALMAHLLRRAGFGAARSELEEYAAKGYEAVVEELLNPEDSPPVEEDIIDRYYGGEAPTIWVGKWFYRMIGTKRPLVEKMALFWHHVLATGINKTEHLPSSGGQIELFQRIGMSDVRTVLLEVSKDPAMIYWLDNHENRKGEPNENYGRELLELFSMGVGNYTEDDIKNAARAFTGWTITQPIPLYPQGHFKSEFQFSQGDHDEGEKTFLGHTGNLNGDDIVDIVVKQPATANFLARHMYNFFVADEPQVPAWSVEPPQNQEAIDTIVKAYMETDGDIVAMLRAMFNSDSFKNAQFKKVKNPTELVAGVLKLVGTYRSPEPGVVAFGAATTLMGQTLLNPPTVEGWHTGKEWIDGGTLNERINFAVNEIGDASKPGIQDIINRLGAHGGSVSPREFTDKALDLVGPLPVDDKTHAALMEYAESVGSLDFSSDEAREEATPRVIHMLQMIAATREFQFA